MLGRYVAKRVLTAIPVLLLATIGVFSLQALLPGDIAVTLAGQGASQADIENVRQTLHLNQPLWHRYGTWLWSALQGNLGTSDFTHATVTSMMASAWEVTLSLVAGALIVSIIAAPIIALTAARFEGGWFDRLTTVIASAGIGIPDFVLGMLFLILFSVYLGIFPIGGYEGPSSSFGGWLSHLVLPVVALAIPVTAGIVRQLRFSLGEVLTQDYVRTAYAKGLRTASVLGGHALPAAAPPAITVTGVAVARMLGGVVIIEQVFGLPGLGQLTVQAIQNKDFPVIDGVIPLFVVAALLANLVADVATMVLRPRTMALAGVESVA